MRPDDARPELTRQWLAFAAQDLEAANRASAPPPLWSVVAFHSQQAAEKALKGFLFWHDRPFRKTHALAELVDQCVDLEPGFTGFLDAAETLTPYAVISRYPDDLVTADEVDAQQARELAEQIVSFVRTQLPADLLP